MGLNGLMFDQRGQELCTDFQYRWETLCWYVPEFSVLFYPFVARRPLDGQQIAVSAYMAVTAVLLAAPLALLTVRQLKGRMRNWLAEAGTGWKI